MDRLDRIFDDAAVRQEHDPGVDQEAEESIVFLAQYTLRRR
jgi:hypothetical protein